MADNFYILRDGKRHGPYTSAELKKHAATGQLLPIDLIIKDGMAKPVPAAKVKGLFPAQPTSGSTARPPQRDEFVAATEEVRPASRRPTARPNRTKLFLILGGGGLLAVIVVAVVVLTSGRKATPSKGPDVAKSDSGNRAEPASRNDGIRPDPARIDGSKRPDPTSDVKVDLPDFSKVDYSLDTSKVDYAKGPQGQPLVRRKGMTKNSARGDVVVEWQGYKDENAEMVQHGLNIVFHGTGDMAEESYYFAGKQHGTIKTWYESGEKESSGLMKDHVKHGKWQFWHKNGKLKQEVHWLAGKQHGTDTTWFESGQKEYETTFVTDDLQGPSYSWWPNGNKGSEVNYKSHVRHGPATWWDDKGKVLFSLRFRNGMTSYDPATGTVDDFAEAKKLILEELGKDREKLEVFFEIFGQPQTGYTPLPNNKFQDQSWVYRCSDGDAVVKCVVFREDTRIPQTVRIISIKKR